MCGRYTQTASLEKLQERFGFRPPGFELKPRHNIAPSQDAPVIVLDRDGRRLELFHWGLIPSWAQDPSMGRRLINARAETLMEKPSFRRSFDERRCLVAADGFYEWAPRPGGAGKTPMRITLQSRAPFAMAGLWDAWKDPAGGEIRSFAIVTTRAEGLMRRIHDRMPVILDAQAERRWLNPKSEPDELRELLIPWAGEALDAYEVTRLVNSPGNDTAACVKAARERPSPRSSDEDAAA